MPYTCHSICFSSELISLHWLLSSELQGKNADLFLVVLFFFFFFSILSAVDWTYCSFTNCSHDFSNVVLFPLHGYFFKYLGFTITKNMFENMNQNFGKSFCISPTSQENICFLNVILKLPSAVPVFKNDTFTWFIFTEGKDR